MNRPIVIVASALVSLSTGTAFCQAPQRTTATYADWTVRCEAHGKAKVCEMAQTMQIKGRPQPISQIAIGRQTKEGKVTIVFGAPANLWLPDGAELLTTDKRANISAKFSRCVPGGCFAEVNLSAGQIKALRALKKNGKLQFKDARKKLIAIPVSFKGFGDAYEALEK